MVRSISSAAWGSATGRIGLAAFMGKRDVANMTIINVKNVPGSWGSATE